MNGIFGSLFFFYNCVFMDYMFVIGLLLCFCSSIFELIWDKLHVDIYLGFDISYLVLATLSILFGLFVWVIIILLSYNLYNLLIIRRRKSKKDSAKIGPVIVSKSYDSNTWRIWVYYSSPDVKQT